MGNKLTSIQIVPIKFKEKKALSRLLKNYRLELNKIVKSDENVDEYQYLNSYWEDKTRVPFFILVNGEVAGFILINNYTRLNNEKDTKSISEFFVIKKFRKQNIGKQAAFLIFDKFPGKWEIAELDKNFQAIEFWRKVIKEYTKGNYQEAIFDNETWKGPMQVFATR